MGAMARAPLREGAASSRMVSLEVANASAAEDRVLRTVENTSSSSNACIVVS